MGAVRRVVILKFHIHCALYCRMNRDIAALMLSSLILGEGANVLSFGVGIFHKKSNNRFISGTLFFYPSECDIILSAAQSRFSKKRDT